MAHDLTGWRGFLFQAEKDNSAFRHYVAEFYLKKNIFLSAAYRFLDNFRKGFIGLSAGSYFYLTSYLFIRVPKNKKYISMVKISTETNSCVALFGADRDKIGFVKFSPMPSLLSLRHLCRGVFYGKAGGFCRIMSRIINRYDLYVALRAVQYLGYYDRFSLEFDKKRIKTILVFSDGNPHGRALLHAAYRKNIKTCFVSHGEPNEPMPPLHCNIACLLGKRSLDRYEKNGSRFGRVVYQGHRETFKRIKCPDFGKKLNIGLFLSKTTALSSVPELIGLLGKVFMYERILIREHPNFSIPKKYRKDFLKDPKVKISGKNSVDEDTRFCDLVFSGNTTTHVDVLLRGRPSLYYRGFEPDFFDRYGYVREELIMDWSEKAAPDEILRFYGKIDQNKVGYHVNIDRDSWESTREINEVVFK